MRTKALVTAAVILSLAVVLAACSSGDGGGPAAVTSVVLPETGQTMCYDASNNPTSCTGTGQDGDKLAGVAWPSPRFTNPDGTTPVTGSVVVDQLTGLMWLRDANCIQTRDAANPGSEFDKDGTAGDGAVTWQHALDFVAGINAGTYSNCGGGYSDWRLPNRKELRSLIDYSRFNPALHSGHPFTGVLSTYFWSSTTYSTNTARAWLVDMRYGYMDNIEKTLFFYVWPARAGQ